MSYPDNRFTTNQPGPNDRRDFQNTQGSGIAQDSAGYNTSNMQEGIPAPHQAGTGHHGHHGQHGTTHGASHHDRDTGNFRGERGSEFVGRGGTNDVQGYGGPGTASGYGPPSGAAAASGMGTNRFDQNAMNTGAGANPSYDDPTWAGNERQFANNGPGMGAGAGAAGTNMGTHHGITGTGGPTTGTHHAGGTGTGVGTGVGTGMGTGPTSGTHHLGRTGAGTAGAMGTGHTGTGTATGAGYDDFSNTRGTGQFQDQRADFNTQGASNRGPGTGNATIGDKLKGAMDKMVGKATDNPQLQQQGQARQTGH